MMQPIYIKDYNYPLPEERIAKYPLKERDQSKLLVYRPSSSNQISASGNQISASGNQISASGNQISASGNQISASGNQISASGNQISASGNQTSEIREDRFQNVGEYIVPGSLLVYNNTRVIQARLEFRKRSSQMDKNGLPVPGARIEVFCLEPLQPHDYQLSLGSTTGCTWKCMVGNAKKWHDGDALELQIENGKLTLLAYKEAQMGNTFAVRFAWNDERVSFAEILDAVGELPIPPYLNRKTEESDKTTYQTVYSRIKGSVAAPTAGLHFTKRVLDDLHKRGIRTTELTLHVGAGTFLPVKTEDANEHTMHTEIIAVPRKAIEDIRDNLGRIVAVGTTSMRTLESLYFLGKQIAGKRMENGEWKMENLHVGQFEPYENVSGAELPCISELDAHEALQAILDYLNQTGQDTLHAETQIMIKPGYKFRIVDQLITNFHQPQSTLLLLVSAFVDGDWKRIYDYALSHDFRFLSYGDSSILTRKS